MSAVADKTEVGIDDIRAALGLESLPAAELEAVLGDGGQLAIAKAWAAGLVEFGSRRFCVTGPVGKDGSSLVLEDGEDWTGPKTKMHKSYRDLRAEKMPEVRKYKKYELSKPERFGEEPVLRPVEISKDEAERELALRVRLTDKGLGDE